MNPRTLDVLAESQPPQWPTVTWRPAKRGSAWNPGGDPVRCRPGPSRCTCCGRRPAATHGPPFVLSFLVSSKRVSFLLCALPSDITCVLDPCLFLQQKWKQSQKQAGRSQTSTQTRLLSTSLKQVSKHRQEPYHRIKSLFLFQVLNTQMKNPVLT